MAGRKAAKRLTVAMEGEALFEVKPRTKPLTLRAFIEATLGRAYDWPQLHARLVAAVERWMLGEAPRGHKNNLMVMMPVRHGKSTLMSQLLPAYEFGLHASGARPYMVIEACYNLEQAAEMNAGTRRLVRGDGFERLFPALRFDSDCENRREFNLERDGRLVGVYRAAGVDSGINGKGAHLLVMDDVLKGRNEAESLAERNKVWRWVVSDLLPRRDPSAMTVFVGSRWHVDDPAGRFLKAAAESKENPQWNVICLPALLDAEAYVDDVWNLGLDGPLPDWRAQGEALWPEKFSRQFLEQQRMDPVTWAALWQQRPLLAENRKLDCLWFERNAIAPDDPLLARVMWWVRAVDLAVSETTHADHTAGVLVGLTDTGHLVLKHVYRFKREWTEARREILAFARVDGSTVELAFGAGGAMRGIVTRLRDEDAEFRPFRVHLVEEVGGKLTRAMEWAPLAAAGRVKMVKGGWNEAWLREVREFTGLQDAEDDQIDAFWVAFEVFSRQAPSILAAPPTEPTERRERRGQATTPSFGPLGRATAGLGRRTFL